MSTLSNSTNASLRSGSSKRLSLNTIESSVTRLLVSTKHLLESLTQWARQEADDKFVSDAYVKLGNDFRAAAKAFTSAGVDISDLGDVPKALRIVLESALSEVPTQENLDKFMPNVRNIIVNLLLTLKVKQLKAKELSEQILRVNNTGSTIESTTSSLTVPQIKEPSHSNSESNASEDRTGRRSVLIEDQKENIDKEEKNSTHLSSQAALAQLQKGNAVLRRASKRFSAYQFAKLANYTSNQLPRIASESSAPTISTTKQDSNQSSLNATDEVVKGDMVYLFLRIGDKTKKVMSQTPLTLASIRLLFVEKFAYSPGAAAFPDIYVLDQAHNVTFELEEMSVSSEVRNGSLLVLKPVENELEVKQSMQDLFNIFEARLESVVQNFSAGIESTLKNFASKPIKESSPTKDNDETQNLKHKFSILSEGLGELNQELQSIKTAQSLKKAYASDIFAELLSELTALKNTSVTESGAESNREYMQHSYSKLSDDSDDLLTKVDDLQDMMEALRKDVAQRGVRIGRQQLKSTLKEIEDVKLALKCLDDFIAEGKPTWKKIWEAELDKVCEEQQFFNLQDDLTRDLREDIKKIEETFDLIEKCSVEQSKSNAKRNKFSTKICLIEPGESLHTKKDAVLNEVAALVPNHESRLEAIERAEKLRQRERELIELNEFQEELGVFVEEKRLRGSGGIEQIEKMRQQKDVENLKSSFGVI